MTDTNHETVLGLLLSDDFLFNSRITGTAKDIGLTVKTARTADALQTLAKQQPPCCVLIDLSNPGLSIGDLVLALRGAGAQTPFLVAFGSHVDAVALNAARNAGCDVVLPRSKFVEELPKKMAEWFGK